MIIWSSRKLMQSHLEVVITVIETCPMAVPDTVACIRGKAENI